MVKQDDIRIFTFNQSLEKRSICKVFYPIFLQLFCAFIIFSLPNSVQTEAIDEDFEWHILSSNEVVTIYEGKQHASGIIPIKFHAVINYPPSRVRSVLSATKRRPEWVPNMVEARVVERVGRYGKTEYLRYAFPWPFFDRTYVLQTNTSFDPKNQTLFTQVKSIDHPNVPRNERYIRAHTYMGTTLIRPEASGQKTYLEFMFLTDMKGNIPKWIFNAIQGGWPEKIIDNLLVQLGRDDIEVFEKWKLIDDTGHDSPTDK